MPVRQKCCKAGHQPVRGKILWVVAALLLPVGNKKDAGRFNVRNVPRMVSPVASLFYDKHFAVYDVCTAFQRTERIGIIGFQYEYALQVIYGYTLVGSRRFGNGGGGA